MSALATTFALCALLGWLLAPLVYITFGAITSLVLPEPTTQTGQRFPSWTHDPDN